MCQVRLFLENVSRKLCSQDKKEKKKDFHIISDDRDLIPGFVCCGSFVRSFEQQNSDTSCTSRGGGGGGGGVYP